MAAIEAVAVAKGAKLLIDALQIGLSGMQVWQEYQAELLALQQARAAEGKTLTMEDVQPLLAKTRVQLAANHDKLAQAAAAQEASRG